MLCELVPTTGIVVPAGEGLGELRVPPGYDLGMGWHVEVLIALVLCKTRTSAA